MSVTRHVFPNLVAFAAGATLGSALDALHTHSGTTSYPHPWIFLMAPWVPLLFGSAGVAVLGAYPMAERFLGRAACPRVRTPLVVAGAAIFVALYVASGFLRVDNPTKLGVILAGVVALFFMVGRSPVAAGVAVLTAAIGPTVESTLTGIGAFSHLQPDFLRIPMWLPALYAAAALALGPIGLALHGRWRAPARDVRASSPEGIPEAAAR